MPASTVSTLCTVCGEPLQGKNDCLVCLLRGGLDLPNDDAAVPARSLIFGDFEIAQRADGRLWELGHGAMGVTYRARDRVLHREVALKVIEVPAGTGGAQTARERFLREARAAAALRHPNVAGVFQFGASAEIDRCYYAMELVEGETLEALVRREGPLPLAGALGMAVQVARALVAAAAHGLIHRDLKPANIMLAPNESGAPAMEVKVIDFGLAKAIAGVADETDLTHGGFVGTPTFASPEQFAGRPADARSDIYSLGVTLWYALTGEVPYPGRTMEEIRLSRAQVVLPVDQLAARKVPVRVIRLLRRILAADPSARPQSARALLAELENCQTEVTAGPRRRRRRTAAVVIGILLVSLAGLAASRWRRPLFSVATSREKSIAVLPFENLSDDETNAYFAAGIQDDVLTSLAKIHALKVISRTSVMAYDKPGGRNLREIGRALGVENVLEGSVRREGNRVLLNVQLIDARHDRHIWAERYDRTAADLIGLQGELAGQIAAALQARIAPEEKALLAKRPTDNPDAYAFYLRARGREDFVNESVADLTVAAQLYQQAIALDPKFALAYARLSIAETFLAQQPGSEPALRVQARAAAEEALRLSHSLGQAHLALGLCFYFTDDDNPIPAFKEFSLAAATVPNDPDTLRWLAGSYQEQGFWREALETYERALELDPRNRDVLLRAADNHMLVRDWVSAAACYERALKLAPDSADARISLAYLAVFRGGDLVTARKLLRDLPPGVDPDGIATESRWDLAMLERDFAKAEQILKDSPPQGFPRTGEGAKDFFEGRTARARGDLAGAQRYFAAAAPHFEEWVRSDPGDGSRHAELGQLYAYMHREEDAIREGLQAVNLNPENRDALLGAKRSANLALIYALLGRPEQAIPLLEWLLCMPGPIDWPDTPYSVTLAELRLRWEWDPLRSDPRFQKILAGPEPATSLTNIPSPAPGKSIAVLPFENLNKDEASAFFAAGIQDDVLTSLGKIHAFRVISRTSVMAYEKLGERNMREIGRALGVETVLEGSVRREGNRVLLNVQLIDAREDRHLWAERYDRTEADSIGLQGELATQIASALEAKLAPEEVARLAVKPTDNPEAYALYLRALGRERAVNRSHEDLEAAGDLYEEAIKLDPRFALAHARLSIVESDIVGMEGDPVRRAKARREAEEAIRLGSSLGEAHMALGLSLYWADKDYGAALKEFSAAAASTPNEPDIFNFIAGIYRRQGRWRESLTAYQHAQDIDPRDRRILSLAAVDYLLVRDWPAAAACYERALAIAPDSAYARIGLAYLEVFRNRDPATGRKILQEIPPGIDPGGKVTEARWDLAMLARDYATAEKILTDFPSEEFPHAGEQPKTFYLGRVALARGDNASAQRYFAAAVPGIAEWVRQSPNNHSSHARLGLLYAYQGRKEDALREGRRAVELEPENQNAFHGADAAAKLALIYARTGEVDQAIDLIERLLATPGPVECSDHPENMTLADLRLRWEWDPLRSDPRFQKILTGPEPATSLTNRTTSAQD